MRLEIKKIKNKIEELDVRGQGCNDDCPEWVGKKSAGPNGCTLIFSRKISPLY